jgi:DNA mismatch repair protein MutL
MNRIRLLPEQVANQIAAGEVIERPASVVKELVENALDAQAGRVTVDIQAGGRSLIRVTDDGLGMSRDDALLCFERHATSKIQRAEDLSAIATLGFRGEALPSIASVSRLTLTTREREGGALEATQVVIAGGKLLEVREASGPPGTCVEVRQLFYNLPARRKFLRSEETERAHVQHYLLLAALSFPEVGFTFTHDQRPVWQLPPLAAADQAARMSALGERLRTLYGAELNLLPLDCTARLFAPAEPEDEAQASERAPRKPSTIHIWGFVGAPGVSRATREDQHLFVNRRPVENRGLNFALLEGYHTALMKGRYPVCCLFVELDPSLVDVNIHPAKREVKFHAERQVRAQVAQAVREALEGRPGRLATERLTDVRALPESPRPPSAAPAPATPAPGRQAAAPPLRPPAPPSGELPGLVRLRHPGVVAPQPAPASARPAPGPAKPPLVEQAPTPSEPPPAPSSIQHPASSIQTQRPLSLLTVPLRLVGVIGNLYVVLESDRGLVMLDQHAAHERVLFEQMLAQLAQGQAPCQRLLLPETVELSPRDAGFLRGQLPALGRLGVSLSEFGERTFLLDGLPPFVRVPDARRFIIELVDELKAASQELSTLRLSEEMVAKTVCRHAVKARDPLAGPELVGLIAALRRCAMPYTCPHGRPTLIELNFRELEKKFGRVQ